MRVVSLFSGAGGLDLGLIDAGLEIVWANDIFEDAVGALTRSIVIAPNGQRTAHSAQPVQPAASCSALVLRPPSARSDSACGAHTATHQPQPVQRVGLISGTARAGAFMMPHSGSTSRR